MKKPTTVFVMNHYQIAFFDERGEQVPEIQKKNLLALLAEHSEKYGYDIEGIRVETPLGSFYMTKEDGEWRTRKP